VRSNGPSTALFDALRTQLNAIAADKCAAAAALGLHENMAQLWGQNSTSYRELLRTVRTVEVDMQHRINT